MGRHIRQPTLKPLSHSSVAASTSDTRCSSDGPSDGEKSLIHLCIWSAVPHPSSVLGVTLSPVMILKCIDFLVSLLVLVAAASIFACSCIHGIPYGTTAHAVRDCIQSIVTLPRSPLWSTRNINTCRHQSSFLYLIQMTNFCLHHVFYIHRRHSANISSTLLPVNCQAFFAFDTSFDETAFVRSALMAAGNCPMISASSLGFFPF